MRPGSLFGTPQANLSGFDMATKITAFPLLATTTAGDDVRELLLQAPAKETGATYTLVETDNGAVIRFTNASQVTVTIPTDASDDLPDGFWCSLFAEGAGGVTLSTTGITLAGSSPNTTISQNEAMVVRKTDEANVWMVVGATAA